MDTCSRDTCTRKATHRGLCIAHYQTERRRTQRHEYIRALEERCGELERRVGIMELRWVELFSDDPERIRALRESIASECMIPGCDRTDIAARNLCWKHYRRDLRSRE